MKAYKKVRLIILNEFLLLPIGEEQQRMLLELLERRRGQSATIFCSQFDVSGWLSQLGGGAVADVIMDRIIPGSYKIKLEGDMALLVISDGSRHPYSVTLSCILVCSQTP